MKKIIVVVLIVSLIFAVGCWDMQEINNIIFPYTLGIDFNDDSENDKGESLYNVSLTYPNIKAMNGKSNGDSEGNYLLVEKGNNIFDASHKLTIKNSQPIDLKHLKVLILSDEVCKDREAIRQLLDGIDRDFRINKMVDLLMTEMPAVEYLEVKKDSKRQDTIEGSIYSILRNQQRSTRFIRKNISEFIEDMDYCSAAHMPIGKIEGKEITIEGTAIFKDYRLVGKLSKEDTRYLSYLINKVKEDGINTEYDGHNLSIEVNKVKTKHKLIESKPNIKVRLTTEIKAQIHEYTMSDGDKIDKVKVLEKMGNNLEKKLHKEFTRVVEKIQKEINTDIIGVYKYLNRYHYDVWDKVKDDWDEIFPKIEIEIDVDVNIQRRGLTT